MRFASDRGLKRDRAQCAMSMRRADRRNLADPERRGLSEGRPRPGRHERWAARKRQRSDRPVLRGDIFARVNLLQALPAGANRVTSVYAALLNGLKGVFNPKAQVHARHGNTN
jgi:hypothetical protein